MDIYYPEHNGTGPGVIVTTQLFGTDSYVRDLADRLAAEGYTVAVPNLYHRAGLSELPMNDEGRARGLELLNGLTRENVLADLRETIAALRAGPVGIVGLSMGGHIAYLAAAELPIAAAALLFPGWLTGTEIPLSRPQPTAELAPGITGRVLLLAGDADPIVPPADIAAIAAQLDKAGVRYEVVEYPDAPHAYFFPETPTYDAEAAHDSWRRILSLLRTELGG
jgi:carboxymethylenebutenolidase